MPYTKPSWCSARHTDPNVTCELRYDHPGWHRAEYGPPLNVTGPNGEVAVRVQVVSWA
jgi:hypothetical protein